jgi:NAD(P)-dependent dehydrogenase (short-subunit alcohol dehydrogenase family)
MTTSPHQSTGTILLVGASRGLGLAMAGQFARKGWRVIGTVRGHDRTALHDLAKAHPGQISIEPLDITAPDQLARLRTRLAGEAIDILFVNAGIASPRPQETIGEVATDEFIRVMLTNALGVMRAVEVFQDLVLPIGTIGVMSSGQGSIANNTRGGFEVYRGSKAALNQYMRSFAARHADDRRALVLLAPGWIRTDMGGSNATFSIDETIPELVDTLLAQTGKPGLRFIDRHGANVPW